MSQEQEDLGFLTDQKKTLILPLPTVTTSVVVRYDEGIKISCILPVASRTITHSEGDQAIVCPSLLFSTQYGEIPMYGKYHDTPSHYIFVYNPEDKSRILACPYLISNVYGNGAICFGGLDNLLSPREAFNSFWASPFNMDLHGEAEEAGIDIFEDYIDSYIEEYHRIGIDSQGWDDITNIICGDKFWASPSGGDAILMSTEKRMLKKIPYKYWRRDHNNYPFVLALGFEREDCWEFMSGSFKFYMDKGFVTALPRHSTEVSALKQRFSQVSAK